MAALLAVSPAFLAAAAPCGGLSIPVTLSPSTPAINKSEAVSFWPVAALTAVSAAVAPGIKEAPIAI